MTTLRPSARPRTPLQRRLLPLHTAVALQGFMLWVPVEKLFMSEIGFDATAVGVMAAAYAAVVPIIEVPSGILADRWSRRGVLIVASTALALCALVGGLSTDVPTYILSALILGVFFAMHSGTLDSIVYDMVLEETGHSDTFEHCLGRVRLTESIALVSGSLLGGWIASLASTRLTYFLTIPFAVLSVLAYLRFHEPRLHKAGEPTSLRRHLAVTYRTLTRRGRLLPIITLAVLTSLILQLILEFGPLWLVALAAPAIAFGPYWAGLMSTFGLGGLLAGRLQLDKPASVGVVSSLMILASLALTATTSGVVVTIAQITLALLIMIASIHVTRLLHDAVPSTIRSGVASGAGAISWMVFLPVALAFGLISTQHGVHTAGWMLTGLTTLAAALLAKLSLSRRRQHSTAKTEPPARRRPRRENAAGHRAGHGSEMTSCTPQSPRP
jgi:predicted MFS family arabinose efflux permease